MGAPQYTLTENIGGVEIYPGVDSSGNYTQPTLQNPAPQGVRTYSLIFFPAATSSSTPAYGIIPTNGFAWRNNANDTTLWSISNAGAITVVGNQSITGTLTVTPTRTVTSGASASLKGLNVAAATQTVTGSTTITAAQGVTSLGRPTITDASAVTINTLATLYIANSPLAAGSVTLTSPYAIWVDDGISRFDGLIQNTSGGVLSSDPAAGVGYSTGAGSTSSQSSNKSTTVVSAPNPSVCGQITMNAANLNANTTVSFTFTNSAIAITDVLVLNHISGGTIGAYNLNAQCGAGSAVINLSNITAGNLAEAVVIQWALIKAVNS